MAVDQTEAMIAAIKAQHEKEGTPADEKYISNEAVAIIKSGPK